MDFQKKFLGLSLKRLIYLDPKFQIDQYCSKSFFNNEAKGRREEYFGKCSPNLEMLHLHNIQLV